MSSNKRGLLARIFRGRETVTPAAVLHQLHGRLMAIDPTYLEGLIGASRAVPEARMDDADFRDPAALIEKRGDVGILRIEGPTFQRGGLLSWFFGGVGYDEILEAHGSLMADPEVARVVAIFDSPGGDAAGLPDAADALFAARGAKPVDAIVNDAAYSAGYWLASSMSDSITVTRTGGVGSIGVVAAHIDVSGWDEKMGLEYSFIHAGERKVDYTMHRPLSDEARERLQAEVDRLYGMFAAAVARNRGIAEDAVRATQAGVFFADAGVSVGLADRVGTLADVRAGVPEPDAPRAPPPSEDGDDGGEDAGASAAAQPPAPAAGEGQETGAATPEPGTPEPAASEVALPDAIAASELPSDVAMALIRRGKKDVPAAEQIAYAQEIRDICAAAGLPDVAADYVGRGTAIAAARAELLSTTADQGDEVSNHLPAMGGAQRGTTVAHNWGATIKKFGGQL